MVFFRCYVTNKDVNTHFISRNTALMAKIEYEKSKEKLAELIAGKFIGIKAQQKPDRYGRLVVWAYTPEGKDVSAEMLKAGLSWHFTKFDDSAFYSQLETEAQKNRTGIWTETNPIAPWNFRKEHKINNSINNRLYPKINKK